MILFRYRNQLELAQALRKSRIFTLTEAMIIANKCHAFTLGNAIRVCDAGKIPLPAATLDALYRSAVRGAIPRG